MSRWWIEFVGGSWHVLERLRVDNDNLWSRLHAIRTTRESAEAARKLLAGECGR